MYGLPENTWIEWKRKRRNTLIGFIIIGTAVGIDCSVVFSTLYLYLRDIVKTDQPQMWYGLIVAFFFLSSTIFGVFCGRWLDRTRRVRAYVNMSLLVQVIGFLLYVIPYHPGILLVGRTICGMGEPFTSVVAGEIFRTYDKKGSTRAMLWLASIYSFGFIIGPSLNFLFTGIEFQIGSIEINNLNFIGIFMAALIITVIIISNCLVHDCSMELDLKEYLQNRQNDRKSSRDMPNDPKSTVDTPNDPKSSVDTPNDHKCSVDTPNDHESTVDNCNCFIISNIDVAPPISRDKELPQEELDKNEATETTKLMFPLPSQNVIPMKNVIPIKIIIKNLLLNKETLLIFVTTLIFVYAIFTSTALLPLLVSITLNWSLKALSFIYACFGIIDFVVLFFLMKYCTSSRSIYFASLVCIVTQIITCCLLICFKTLERNKIRDIFMVALFLPSMTLGWCFDDALIRVLLANMVPSKIQSFSETLRAGVCKIAIVAGSFTVAVLLPWVHWWSVGIMVFNILILIGFILRRKQLIHPGEIPLMDYTSTTEGIKVTYGLFSGASKD